MSGGGPDADRTARAQVARALAGAVGRFPDLDPVPLDTAGLPARDAALALAIHRTCLQRWLSLEHLLGPLVRGGTGRLEPALHGILLSAAAQVLFFDRLPHWAVVHASVELARQLLRPGAAALANAVLRRLGALVAGHVGDRPWTAAADRLPTPGGYVQLREPCLPPPDRTVEHLAAATSHPHALVDRWVKLYGPRTATLLCRHGMQNPPTFLAGPDGHRLWTGGHADLAALLEADTGRWVQDPAAGRAVECTRDLAVRRIIDYCAGRGTKTRQLAALHPGATVQATSVDPMLRQALGRQFAGSARVEVRAPADLAPGADLLVLDVPCTNTAVLARRPEARYRFGAANVRALCRLQRRIAQAALPLVRPGGFVLYCTCSLEPRENRHQVRWLSALGHAAVLREVLTMPGGDGAAYHDGAYLALLRLPP